MSLDQSNEVDLIQTPIEASMPRRKFFTYAGLSAGAKLFAAFCKKETSQDSSLTSYIHSLGGGKNGGKIADVNNIKNPNFLTIAFVIFNALFYF